MTALKTVIYSIGKNSKKIISTDDIPFEVSYSLAVYMASIAKQQLIIENFPSKNVCMGNIKNLRAEIIAPLHVWEALIPYAPVIDAFVAQYRVQTNTFIFDYPELKLNIKEIVEDVKKPAEKAKRTTKRRDNIAMTSKI